MRGFGGVANLRSAGGVRRLLRCALLMVLLPLAGMQAQNGANLGVDLQGHAVRQLDAPGVRVVVLVFAASDCPISNRYVPEIARLRREFAARGVRFWWVFPNADDTAPKVRRHDRAFSIEEDVVLDRRQTLVKRSQVRTTPEAAVFAVEKDGLREAYHGRIDDRYIAFGQERPQAQRHDLAEAIAATLEGKQAQAAGGPAVGCSIEFVNP